MYCHHGFKLFGGEQVVGYDLFSGTVGLELSLEVLGLKFGVEYVFFVH